MSAAAAVIGREVFAPTGAELLHVLQSATYTTATGRERRITENADALALALFLTDRAAAGKLRDHSQAQLGALVYPGAASAGSARARANKAAQKLREAGLLLIVATTDRRGGDARNGYALAGPLARLVAGATRRGAAELKDTARKARADAPAPRKARPENGVVTRCNTDAPPARPVLSPPKGGENPTPSFTPRDSENTLGKSAIVESGSAAGGRAVGSFVDELAAALGPQTSKADRNGLAALAALPARWRPAALQIARHIRRNRATWNRPGRAVKVLTVWHVTSQHRADELPPDLRSVAAGAPPAKMRGTLESIDALDVPPMPAPPPAFPAVLNAPPTPKPPADRAALLRRLDAADRAALMREAARIGTTVDELLRRL